MNISAKQTNQSPDVAHCMRGFKSNWRRQIIDEHTDICVNASVCLPSALRISPCWQVNNDRHCKPSSQNRVQNFILSTYLPSRVVTVVKQHDGNNVGSAYRMLRSQHGEGSLRDGSIRKQRSQSLKCAHKRFVRTAVRLMPIRNNV